MILNLMYASGARAQEICDLRVRDVQFQKNLTRLTLTGKGNKVRRIVIAKSCADMLKHYLDWRGISHDLNRHIFSSQTHEHMTVSCIEEIYKKYIAEARERHPGMFLQSKYTPHTMRHTTAIHMLEAGVPLMAIKNFLGHASLLRQNDMPSFPKPLPISISGNGTGDGSLMLIQPAVQSSRPLPQIF